LFSSRELRSLCLTVARVPSLADCAVVVTGKMKALAVSNNVETSTFENLTVYSPISDSVYASMISNVETISAVGLKVAATLQYFVSDSSMAWETAFSEIPRPVTTW